MVQISSGIDIKDRFKEIREIGRENSSVSVESDTNFSECFGERKKPKYKTFQGRKKSILSETDMDKIITLRKRGYSLREIAEAFRVSHETIRKVSQKK